MVEARTPSVSGIGHVLPLYYSSHLTVPGERFIVRVDALLRLLLYAADDEWFVESVDSGNAAAGATPPEALLLFKALFEESVYDIVGHADKDTVKRDLRELYHTTAETAEEWERAREEVRKRKTAGDTARAAGVGAVVTRVLSPRFTVRVVTSIEDVHRKRRDDPPMTVAA